MDLLEEREIIDRINPEVVPVQLSHVIDENVSYVTPEVKYSCSGRTGTRTHGSWPAMTFFPC